MAVTEAQIEEFMGRAVTELGAAEGVVLHRIGDELGIWKAMAGAGPLTPAQVAERSGCNERYIREWLAAEAAAAYVDYDPATGTFTLPELSTAAMADESSPMFLGGAWQLTCSVYQDMPKVLEAFRTGGGVAWAEHSHDLFEGVERFFRPGYNANLVNEWLPSLDGVVEKLERGATVADVGCGHGASTIILAQAFPNSTFVGFDYHDASIVAARKAAAEAGVADRVSFEVAPAQSFPGTDYDLVAFFDCLHDMGDPTGAAAHVLQSLAPDGTWMIVEPYANDDIADNLTPVGRVFYSASTLICTPASLSQEVGAALGAQAGEARLRDVVTAGGFTRFRRAAETPFNLVLEARP